PAGTTENLKIIPGEATRIFTGAPLPRGADTVVMQEKTLQSDGILFIKDEALKTGSNVRAKGSEALRGSLALEQGTLLSPAAIGFLAGLGETTAWVYPMPSVSIIVTGKELQSPGQPLSAGGVYESNSFSLRAALQQAGITDTRTAQSDDDLP
ncbi:MAG: molybdopterin molybdenumtransferase MoeA, partial [Chitinophagaceae bacterium]